ncbi:unnamed protein product [Lampetra planeri]
MNADPETLQTGAWNGGTMETGIDSRVTQSILQIPEVLAGECIETLLSPIQSGASSGNSTFRRQGRKSIHKINHKLVSILSTPRGGEEAEAAEETTTTRTTTPEEEEEEGRRDAETGERGRRAATAARADKRQRGPIGARLSAPVGREPVTCSPAGQWARGFVSALTPACDCVGQWARRACPSALGNVSGLHLPRRPPCSSSSSPLIIIRLFPIIPLVVFFAVAFDMADAARSPAP